MSTDSGRPVRLVRDVLIPMPDGAQLAANLYIPEDRAAGERFPGLFTFTPYHKDGRPGDSAELLKRHFAGRGYAVMHVDFRGTGSSGGINPYPFDPQERADGHQVVEWMAAQSWCTGAVGIFGTSYGGITALSIASTRPPHLRAIVPIHATMDNYEWYLRTHGCLNLAYSGIGWAVRMAAANLEPPIIQDPHGRWFRVWREHLAGNVPWVLSWHGEPPDPEFWERRKIPYERIDVPTFGICGWYDAYTAPTFMVYQAVRAPKRVLIGPWKHVFPDNAPYFPIGAAHEMDRWWDRWLKGICNGVDDEPPVTIFVMGGAPAGSRWRHEAQWPLARARPLRLYLAADHRLDEQTSDAISADDYAYDSRVGTGSIEWHSGYANLPLPGDQSFDDHLSLVYTSAPLERDTEVTGPPVARVFISASAGEMNLAVKLCVVDATGQSVVLAQGWANPTRATAHAPRIPLTPGEAREVVVPLHPTCRVIPAGRRLRLCLAGADFPEIFPTPEPYTMRVHRGGDRASHVEVPIAPPRAEDLPAPRLEPADPALTPATPADGSTTHIVHREVGRRVVAYETRGEARSRADGATTLHSIQQAVVTTDADRPWTTSLRTEYRVDHLRPVGTISTRARMLVTMFGVRVDAEIDVDGQPFYRQSWMKEVDDWTGSEGGSPEGDRPKSGA